MIISRLGARASRGRARGPRLRGTVRRFRETPPLACPRSPRNRWFRHRVCPPARQPPRGGLPIPCPQSGPVGAAISVLPPEIAKDARSVCTRTHGRTPLGGSDLQEMYSGPRRRRRRQPARRAGAPRCPLRTRLPSGPLRTDRPTRAGPVSGPSVAVPRRGGPSMVARTRCGQALRALMTAGPPRSCLPCRRSRARGLVPGVYDVNTPEQTLCVFGADAMGDVGGFLVIRSSPDVGRSVRNRRSA
jgi:hypothetical protein